MDSSRPSDTKPSDLLFASGAQIVVGVNGPEDAWWYPFDREVATRRAQDAMERHLARKEWAAAERFRLRNG